MTDVDMADVRGQYLSYSDGLYWSLITAASIGYGDVTPKAGAGRVIGVVLGVMGVATVGVVAGLVIRWITPRRLEVAASCHGGASLCGQEALSDRNARWDSLGRSRFI